MLEFALRQERAKYQKLQYGSELTNHQAPNQAAPSSEGKMFVIFHVLRDAVLLSYASVLYTPRLF